MISCELTPAPQEVVGNCQLDLSVDCYSINGLRNRLRADSNRSLFDPRNAQG
jgi:hypothetical protein